MLLPKSRLSFTFKNFNSKIDGDFLITEEKVSIVESTINKIVEWEVQHCNNCGNKILDKNQKICEHCGEEL